MELKPTNPTRAMTNPTGILENRTTTRTIRPIIPITVGLIFWLL
jgi:hypothetical protein